MTEQLQKHLDRLFDFLRIPSISSLPEHHADVLSAADFVRVYLEELGFTRVGFHYAKGHEAHPPIVYGEKITDVSLPTVIVYCHYDVQPVDPLSEWRHDPFQPQIIDGNILARGAGDDKGQLIAALAAVEELSEENSGRLPLNIKVVFEGQEEFGGENIEAWVVSDEAKELLTGDVFVINDVGFATETVPAITYGLRGIAYFQLDVTVGSTDLHSGHFGGGVLNPINALSYMLTRLYDVESGKILIPGIYDSVIDVKQSGEREKLARVPFDENEFLRIAGGVPQSWGEEGYTLKERITARPTLDINGIWGGFTGDGAKTVIPAKAHAKFSIRLVADQTPQQVKELVEAYIPTITPKGVHAQVTYIHGGDGVLVDTDSAYVQMAKESLQDVFGTEPVFNRIGGSVPLAALVKKTLNIEPLMFGYTLPSDNFHAPNEKFGVDQFEKGIRANKLFYTRVGSIKK